MKQIKRERRARRVRSKILAKSTLPRLTVFRSNKYIYAQLIDDSKGKTLVSVNEREIKGEDLSKTLKAAALGTIIAKKAVQKKIKKVVFDKGAYRYHGRIKVLADKAREGGLEF